MQRVIEDLYKGYGFKIIDIKKIEYGLWEESFEVQTQNKKYFAKRFWRKSRVETRYNEMLHGLLLSQELRAKGFPVPELILTKSMEPLAHIDNETYLVTEWIDGKTFHPGELSEEQAFSMGCLLGKFHSYFQVDAQYESIELPKPSEAVIRCENLLLQFETHSGEFANQAKKILNKEIQILKSITDDYIKSLNTISRVGPIYGSFWAEQVLFDHDHKINALVDWTDGAGRIGCWIEDMDTAIHVSAFHKEAILAFCRGYQRHNQIKKEEWESVLNLACYTHLTDTWIFDSWLNKTNRRMEHWEKIALCWITQIPIRYHQWGEIRKQIIET